LEIAEDKSIFFDEEEDWQISTMISPNELFLFKYWDEFVFIVNSLQSNKFFVCFVFICDFSGFCDLSVVEGIVLYRADSIMGKDCGDFYN
jgi:hypothetical protein